MDKDKVLKSLGINDVNRGACSGTLWLDTKGPETGSLSPVDGEIIANITNISLDDYEQIIAGAQEAFLEWRKWPAPKRGEVVRP